MRQIKSFLLSSACAVLVSVCFSAMAHAEQKYGPVVVEGALKAQTTLIENDDLGTETNTFQDSQSLEARVRATGTITNDIKAMGEFRAVKSHGEGGGFDPDTGEALGADDFLELRQYWVQFTSVLGYTPLSAKIGRQRFSEPAGLWWGRDFDAVRVSYDTTLLNSFIAVGQNLASYRTTGSDFRNDDQDILRIFAESAWQWQYNHFLEARFVYMKDYSGRSALGSLVPADNRDDLDSDLVWAGLRSRGQIPSMLSVRQKASYRIDLMGLAGHDKIEDTTAAAVGVRSVSGYDDKDVLAWAFDSNLRLPLPVASDPELILGYAYGSGDDNTADGTNHTFRQTGLDSNSTRYGLSMGSIHNFGSVLRPDLSNIHILTAGLSLPLFAATDVTGIYHYYLLDEESGDIATSGISAPLNNGDHELGHGFDLLFNTELTEEFGLNTGAIGPVTLKTTLGAFNAGEAYSAAEDEWSSRAYVELQIRF